MCASWSDQPLGRLLRAAVGKGAGALERSSSSSRRPSCACGRLVGVDAALCSRHHCYENVELADVPGKGRVLVASRDFQTGELLLREEPAIAVAHQDQRKWCLHCQRWAADAKTCQCGFRRCSACLSKQPHDVECRLLQHLEDLAPLKWPEHTALWMLKGIALKWQNPDRWALLMSLCGHEDTMRERRPEVLANIRRVAEIAASLLLPLLPSPGVSVQELVDLQLLTRCNAHTHQRAGDQIATIFPDAVAMLEHNCQPNCSWVEPNEIEIRQDRIVAPLVISLRAVRPIRKGEAMSIS
eukprot:TRINITY_DN47490_c0_g1_i2.p1 TRINITY_DN47490_c0_g1~~TRINITY_DN47490_c0_g1_i2.p1  ORF type:complete len:298 (+),score=33.47 TRINITY_DN47490_c0_g1_i2:34-927(+)